MKNKKLFRFCIFLIILLIPNIVQAINKINLQITLPEGLIQEIPQDTQTKQYYEKNHIYLYATNEKKDESIMIIQLENELTNQIDNLNVLSTEELDSFIQQYNQLKNKENQKVLKQETYKAKENLFIDTIFETTIEGKTLQQEEYYTIVEKKAMIVSANFLEKEVDTEKIRNMIDSMIISSNEEIMKKDTIFLWGIAISAILLAIIYVIKEKNNKPNLGDNEKISLLKNVKEYLEKGIKFDQFKGILILFVVTIGLNVISLTVGTIQGLIQYKQLIQYSMMDKTYTSLTILQNIIQLLGILYIAYLLTKKKEQTIKKVQKIFAGMFIGVILLTIIRLILLLATNGVNQEFLMSTFSEIRILAKSIIYMLIWYLYFRNSIRVSIYYHEKTLEQILQNPKRGYQANFVNKKLMEFKIIQYFKKQKAFDYASGIYINKLPKEYATNLSLQDLNSKKIIRLKKAKYYLSNKNLENPKTEVRKTAKTVAWMIIIYILVLIILNTL